jgi:DNA mismatch endonuclease (patch repair protein)
MSPSPTHRSNGAPAASSAGVRRRMQATRRRDTPQELAVRRALHARGLRYRVDSPPVPGTRRRADVVFTRARVAVYVHGCFWHSCPMHATRPRTNADWWSAKLDGNRRRDDDTRLYLEELGWRVLEIWEHEDPDAAADRVAGLVRSIG